MFTASVYKIAVLSLSGMVEETYAVKEQVRKWNLSNAQAAGKLFLPIDDAQAADVLLGIIGNRLEKTSLVEDALRSGKRVLLFFNAYLDPANTIASEAQAVVTFRAAAQARCFCAEYNGVQQLDGLLYEKLNKIQQT